MFYLFGAGSTDSVFDDEFINSLDLTGGFTLYILGKGRRISKAKLARTEE